MHTKMKYLFLLVCTIAVACSFAENGNSTKPTQKHNYKEASKILPKVYYGELQKDLYCGCPYRNKKDIDVSKCGYEPRYNPKRKSYERAKRIEWEHIVTAHNMGHFRPCWKNGGRENCRIKDPEFEFQEGDLHNLYPAIGEINGDRNNFMYSQWSNSPELMYGSCETVVDFKMKKAQPRPEIRGLIARVHFYMEDTYGIKLSRQDRQLFTAWDNMYPVSREECLRDERIAKIQGNHNRFVWEKCK